MIFRIAKNGREDVYKHRKKTRDQNRTLWYSNMNWQKKRTKHYKQTIVAIDIYVKKNCSKSNQTIT